MSGNKISSAVLLVILTAAFAAGGSLYNQTHSSDPWFDATGGPDAYGYTWVDSDEPGGPVYQWIDLAGTGEVVGGLGDDNYVGPYDMGFDYDYYWYMVDEFYIGSNGYIKFPPAYNIASPFPASIPLTAGANDYIGIYTSDLNFVTGGECYYWTNNVDTCIVSYHNVPYWSYGGSHTFQVIFDAVENTVVMNFLHMDEGTQTAPDIIIGVENINGQVGLQHSADSIIPHDEYCVVFYRPETTPYQVHDFSVDDVLNEGSKAIFVELDEDYAPVIWIKNVGNQPETDSQIRCDITNEGGSSVYNEVALTGPLNPGEVAEITLPAWSPGFAGQYAVNINLTLPGDMNTANNIKVAEIEIVEMPGELKYDDGTAETGMAWNGDDGGYGMYFESPIIPADITMARYYISTANPPNVFIAQIVDDDGGDGMPGTVLFEELVDAPTANQWYQVNPNVTVDDGKFYAVWQQTQASSVYMGIDQTVPISRHTWELTSTWAPYRDAETDEAMIRVMVGQGQIPEPVIDTSPDSLFFGEVTVNDTTCIPLTVYNIGTFGDLIIDDISLFGVPGEILVHIEGFAGADTLAPGDSLELLVFYHPLLPLPNVGSINFSNNSYMNPYVVYFEGSGIEVGVNSPDSNIPQEYSLSQNYPNPFNSQTSFNFALPTAGHVSLALYDLQGRQTAVISDGWFEAGTHRASINAKNLASGIYLARLTAGDFTQTRKVVFIK